MAAYKASGTPRPEVSTLEGTQLAQGPAPASSQTSR